MTHVSPLYLARSIQDEYDQIGAESYTAFHKRAEQDQKHSLPARGLGGRLANTIRSLHDGQNAYGGDVPAAVHGAPHTVMVRMPTCLYEVGLLWYHAVSSQIVMILMALFIVAGDKRGL